MAYMTQKLKKQLMPGIKKVLEHYGVKATFSVKHHSKLVCTIREGGINFGGDFITQTSPWGDTRVWDGLWYDVNTYHIDKAFKGISARFAQSNERG